MYVSFTPAADAADRRSVAASRAARKRQRKAVAVAVRTTPPPAPKPKPQPDRHRQAVITTRARSTVAIHTKIAELNSTLRRQQADFAAHPGDSYLAYCIALNLRELADAYYEVVRRAAGAS